eukprot:c18463_g2_i1 orf=2-250(-)
MMMMMMMGQCLQGNYHGLPEGRKEMPVHILVPVNYGYQACFCEDILHEGGLARRCLFNPRVSHSFREHSRNFSSSLCSFGAFG